MKRFTLMMSALLVLSGSYAQRLSDLCRQIPKAVCAEAAMPEAMAKKYERTRVERNHKYITPTSGTHPVVSAAIETRKSRFMVLENDQAFSIRVNPEEKYTISTPNYRLLNTSHGREAVKGSEGKFNVKKDRLSYAILQNGNEIQIINRDHKAVPMNDFEFTTTSEAIRMEGNKIVLNVPAIAIAHGDYPLEHKILCRHIASDATYTFDLQMSWPKELEMSGETRTLALSPFSSTTSDHLGLLCDLETKKIEVVELPLTINADGKDGRNGKKGRYGANGTDKKTYTDKDGNTRTIAGTCAKPGEDGEDGEDGTDGGKFLFFISTELVEAYGLDGLVATIDAGKGGKGGKGGEGGIHGKGSGCSGKAPDGKNGKDGKDGKRGDFLYVLADVNSIYQQIIK